MRKNELHKASSLYLQQHAHNPVHWQMFSEQLFDLAEKENKLILFSSGYSSCHWCHVMERECFEDEEVAHWMNEHFICVKIDREERPDIDHIYMTAVQLMTNQGGWPLNCFTLPDGRPVYGGTYFPKDRWINVLKSLADIYQTNPEKVIEYAEELTKGVQQAEMLEVSKEFKPFKESADLLHDLVRRWKKSFDMREGGFNPAPKFPMPNQLQFLWNYALRFEDSYLLDWLKLTLYKMARGGIYDQVGGGFARYSVDVLWKAPHFEKMLYDNAQLLELYATAYQTSKEAEWLRTVSETLNWLYEEMRDEQGGFYASMDADSEGVEGLFYVWEKEEIEKIIPPNRSWVLDYWNVNDRGKWENGHYILLRRDSDENWSRKLGLSVDEFHHQLNEVRFEVSRHRQKRIPPTTDKKLITGWNGLMLSGLIKSLDQNAPEQALKMALPLVDRLKNHWLKNGELSRLLDVNPRETPAFLDDYAYVIQALIDWHSYRLDTTALQTAQEMTVYVLTHFSDPSSDWLYFSRNNELFMQKIEVHDQVIPSSNSVMAKNLYRLGLIFTKPEWISKAKTQLSYLLNEMESWPSAHSNWADLYLRVIFKYPVVKISGKEAAEWVEVLRSEFKQIDFTGLSNPDEPFIQSRLKSTPTIALICDENSCSAPLENLEHLRTQLKTHFTSSQLPKN